jgi:ABC-type glutathione transport system ATPase component
MTEMSPIEPPTKPRWPGKAGVAPLRTTQSCWPSCSSSQASILQLLLELRQTLGLTLLFVNHNMEVVEYLADEVAIMYQGKIIEQGPTDAVCGQPTHAYTQRLLAAVPHLRRSA